MGDEYSLLTNYFHVLEIVELNCPLNYQHFDQLVEILASGQNNDINFLK